MTVPNLTLNTGYTMPALGLGTWTYSNAEAEELVYYAISVGYRLIDTARYYGNEIGVGRGIRRAISEHIVQRKDIFVTSKVVPSGYSQTVSAIESANKDLGLEYIDLVLIHWSGSRDTEMYKALEEAVTKKIVRSIGISNYYTPAAVDAVTAGSKTKPAVIQNENHLHYQNTHLQEYADSFGCVVESYYPFGGRGHTKSIMDHKAVQVLAAKYGKTPAQIILRWHVQSGYIPLPGSKNRTHIQQNLEVFDFELSAEEMKTLAALDTGKRYDSY